MAKRKDPKKLDSDNNAKLIGRIYQNTSSKIEEIIVGALASKKLTDPNFLRQKRLEVLNTLKQAQDLSGPVVADAVRKAYSEGSLKAREAAAAFIGSPMNQTFSQADQRAVEIIIDNALDRLNQGSATIARRADDVLKQASLAEIQAIANINVSGPAFDDAAEQLENALRASNLTALGSSSDEAGQIGLRFLQINGRNYQPGKYAELVVRTESRAAHSRATINRLVTNGWDVVQVTSHSTSCDICSEFDGNKYSISGETPGYDILPEEPPFHPNCRHLITAALP
jgi:hypothetical protein